MKRIILFAATAVIFVFSAFAQPEETSSFWGAKPLPSDIQVTLEPGKSLYYLGENIILYYCIKISGTDSFSVSVGGDYRGSTRADRFHVTAISADGKPVADPTPLMRNKGGNFFARSYRHQTGGAGVIEGA